VSKKVCIFAPLNLSLFTSHYKIIVIMINRVLIRIKVVQMLYSYLLTQSEFRIQPMPGSDASQDKKYAYRLYTSLLLAILELSGRNLQRTTMGQGVDNGSLATNKYLHNSAIVNSLMSNNDIRAMIARNAGKNNQFESCLPGIYDKIIMSAPYRSYTHTHERDIPVDVKFWSAVIKSVIATDPDFIGCARRDETFTMAGFDMGVDMTIDTLNGYGDSRRLFTEATNSLETSLNKAYELYHALLWLPVELTRLQEQRLDAARNKYLPSAEELNPNMKFVDNKFVAALSECEQFEAYFKEHPFTWDDEPLMLRALLDKILASDIYREYMESPTADFASDAELWRRLFKQVILPDNEIAETLESKSVYWNDDLDIMGTFVLKTVKRIGASGDGSVKLLPKYKDDEDACFGTNLFISAVKHKDEYRSYIERFINEQNWDPERLALMDIVIMITAITELLDYPAIPIPVTLNEYIEIANSYSTPRSGQFINGILYSIIKYLKEQHLLLKD